MGVDKYRKSSRRGSGRDPGSFIALPWCVIDSPRYKELSHTAKSLLIEFARQFVKDNNGKLLASSKYLSKRGWNSAGVIQRAKKSYYRQALFMKQSRAIGLIKPVGMQ